MAAAEPFVVVSGLRPLPLSEAEHALALTRRIVDLTQQLTAMRGAMARATGCLEALRQHHDDAAVRQTLDSVLAECRGVML